jgi:hydrogenase nickel incorporation protein HypB
MFHEAEAVILNKIDLLPYSGVSLDELTRNVRDVNPWAPIFPVSCRTGEGITDWVSWLRTQIAEEKGKRTFRSVAA